MKDPKTTTNIIGGAGLALLGATCCALPIALVTLGMGSAVASLVSAMPWLTIFSEYKIVTFSFTTIIVTYSWWRIRRVDQCSVADAKKLRIQRVVLWAITAVFLASVFAAYAGSIMRRLRSHICGGSSQPRTSRRYLPAFLDRAVMLLTGLSNRASTQSRLSR